MSDQGYSWHHMVKIAPEDGQDLELDLMEEFAETHGPLKTDLTYPQEAKSRTDVNKVQRQNHFGFRPTVVLTIEIFNISYHRVIAKMVNALTDKLTAVYLSLDGGHTYRQVKMSRVPSPRPIRGKTIVGAQFRLGLSATELIDDMPEMADTW